MKNRKNRQSALLSIVILFFGYLLIRYALLDLHKMKDWPTVLFLFCLTVIIICFLTRKTIIPLIISLSYVAGFTIGYIFQNNGVDAGGGTTNNLWTIWTIAVLAFVFIAIIIELYTLKKTNG